MRLQFFILEQITNMRLFPVVLLILITALNIFAKKNDIELLPAVYDFGKVYNWENPPAVFKIINHSSEKLQFLPTFPTQNFQVKLPQTSIAPGKSAKIEVYYYTSELGSFSEKISIYSGSSEKAIELKIKGEIVSMSASAHTACPTINKDKPQAQDFYQEVLVINAKTREPIENAEIKWFYNNRAAHKSTTDKSGKVVEQIVLGNYSLLASREGFEPNTANGLISRNSGIVTIPLKPIEEATFARNDLDNKQYENQAAEEGIYYPKTQHTVQREKTIEPTRTNLEESKTSQINPRQDKGARQNQVSEENTTYNSPVKTRADYSGIGTEEVELEFYNNDRAEKNNSDTGQDYLERIEALKEAEREEEQAWESPFDYSENEIERSNQQDTTLSKTESASELAETAPLEFYNRERPPTDPEKDMGYAAYQAYLEEVHQLEEKQNAGYEKPDFFSEETEAAPSQRAKTEQPLEKAAAEADLIEDQKTPLDPNVYAANNILFLIDVSTSMKGAERIDLLKMAMNNLVEVLREFDFLTVMTYSSETDILLEHGKVEDKEALKNQINSLEASGWTFGLKGLNHAFEIVNDHFISSGNNQIIISTDGKFNNPTFTERDLYSLVRSNRGDTKISVLGFGDDQDALKTMQRLARVGNGNFLHITNKREAGDILVEEIKTQSQKQ
ncbi:MAG: VWA domain-containing protein [Chitinophagales bacterium]